MDPGLDQAPVSDVRTPVTSRSRGNLAVPGRRTQRDVMRQLVRGLGLNREAVVAAYAAAELNGEVSRMRDANGTDAETYARALWADGVKKGWF